jgi:hypothetical protein
VKTVQRLQDLIGRAMAANNDRNPNRFAQVNAYLQDAHETCWRALGGEPLLELKDHSNTAQHCTGKRAVDNQQRLCSGL